VGVAQRPGDLEEGDGKEPDIRDRPEDRYARFHGHAASYLSLNSGCSSNHAAIRLNPSSNVERGSHPSSARILRESATHVSVSHTRAGMLPHFGSPETCSNRRATSTASPTVVCTPVPTL